MCLLLETIKVAQGKLENLPYHQERVRRSMQRFFPQAKEISLADAICVPEALSDNKIYKCRVLYDKTIRRIEFQPYVGRPLRTLALVEIPLTCHYSYKWADRSWIERLREQVPTDDILMVRNGLLTDMSYANVALWDGKRWYTPRTPLLEGTRRQQLLEAGLLALADIRPKDLGDFLLLKPINALLDLSEAPSIPTEQIRMTT
ncbi:MAG: aminotransferase class IV [Cytophagales bacterium]|nr:aminotransferase class IV [Bernardetiaceae bacterium]MDW8211497.1 aminotransferase class IV [Cytophagales bacterium]